MHDLKGINLDLETQRRIDEQLIQENHKTGLILCGVILMLQFIMVAFSLLRGGPFSSARKLHYFTMYLILITITIAYLVGIIRLRRQIPLRVAWYLNLTTAYSWVLALWASCVTLLDLFGSTNISVFSYVILPVSVFSMMRPWQSVAVYGSAFLLLNTAVFVFQRNPAVFRETPNIFSIMINSLFITVWAITIAMTLSRYRISSHYHAMLIERQYTEISDINSQLHQMARTDQLTNLGNRRFLDLEMERLERERPDKGTRVTGMMVDIDFFKQFNDYYGHLAGDTCLSEIAKLLQKFTAGKDAFVARYGGEEFFICIRDCTNSKECAEALRKQIEDRQLVRGDLECGCITVSIGVNWEENWEEIGQDEFIRRCDEALYYAKNCGRNRVSTYREARRNCATDRSYAVAP